MIRSAAAVSALLLISQASVCRQAWAAAGKINPPPAGLADAGSPASSGAPGGSARRHTASKKSEPKNADTPDQANAGGMPFTSSHGPINIQSQTLSLDYKNKAVLFNGHVHALQSGTELTSDTLHVNYEENFKDVKDMTADGNVRISQGGRWATSNHAVMNQKNQTVVMTGDPVVHDGPNQITGSKITVYLQTGKSVVEHANAMIFPKDSGSQDNSKQENTAAAGPDDKPPPDEPAPGSP